MRLTVSGCTSIPYHYEWRVSGQGTRSLYPWPNAIINAHDLDITDSERVCIETPHAAQRTAAASLDAPHMGHVPAGGAGRTSPWHLPQFMHVWHISSSF